MSVYDDLNNALKSNIDVAPILASLKENPRQMTADQAADILKLCFSKQDYLSTTKSILAIYPGVAWHADADSLESPLRFQGGTIVLSHLHESLKCFPVTLNQELRSLVHTCLKSLKALMGRDSRIHNTQLIAHLTSRLIGRDLAAHFSKGPSNKKASMAKIYFAHLMHYKGAKKSPKLEGWSELKFLPLRIHAHIETLVYLAGGYFELSVAEEARRIMMLEKIIIQELKTYRVAKVIKQALAAIESLPTDTKLKKTEERSKRKDTEVIIRDLIKAQIDGLSGGESFALEAGWETHSIYIQFYRQLSGGPIEVIVHDRRDESGGEFATQSLGCVNHVAGLDRYLRYYLEKRFDLVSDTNDRFYKKMCNHRKKLFKPDAVAQKPLVHLASQISGNCVVASHDGVLVNTCGQEDATWIRMQEVNALESKDRRKALSTTSLHDSFRALSIEVTDCLESNHKSYKDMCLKEAWEKPTKSKFDKLCEESRELALEIIRLRMRNLRGRLADLQKERLASDDKKWTPEQLKKYDNWCGVYVYLAERLACLGITSAEVLDEMFSVLDHGSQWGTGAIFEMIMDRFVDGDGLLPESVYERCHKRIQGSFGCMLDHGKTYTFYERAHLYIYRHPELIDEAISVLGQVDDPFDEPYHWAAAHMIKRARKSHPEIVDSKLREALASDNGGIINNALTLIDAYQWENKFRDEILAVMGRMQTPALAEMHYSEVKLLTVLEKLDDLTQSQLKDIVGGLLNILRHEPCAFAWIHHSPFVKFLNQMSDVDYDTAMAKLLKSAHLLSGDRLALYTESTRPLTIKHLIGLHGLVGAIDTSELRFKLLRYLYKISQMSLSGPKQAVVVQILETLDLEVSVSFAEQVESYASMIPIARACDEAELIEGCYTKLEVLLKVPDTNGLYYNAYSAKWLLCEILKDYNLGFFDEPARKAQLESMLTSLTRQIIKGYNDLDPESSYETLRDQKEAMDLYCKLATEAGLSLAVFFKESFQEYLSCFGRGSPGRFDHIFVLGEKYGVLSFLSPLMIQSIYKKDPLSDLSVSTSCIVNTLPRLCWTHDQVTLLLQKYFKNDKIFQKALFAPAKLNGGIANFYVAKILIAISQKQSIKLYLTKLKEKHPDRIELLREILDYRQKLLANTTEPIFKMLSLHGRFCVVKPDKNLDERMLYGLKEDLKSIGYEVIMAKNPGSQDANLHSTTVGPCRAFVVDSQLYVSDEVASLG